MRFLPKMLNEPTSKRAARDVKLDNGTLLGLGCVEAGGPNRAPQDIRLVV